PAGLIGEEEPFAQVVRMLVDHKRRDVVLCDEQRSPADRVRDFSEERPRVVTLSVDKLSLRVARPRRRRAWGVVNSVRVDPETPERAHDSQPSVMEEL